MTTFSKKCVCIAFVALLTSGSPALGDMLELLEMAEKLDKIEKQDFDDAIDRAGSCTSARDFVCAEAQLISASKVTNDSRDAKLLASARRNLLSEREALATELRLAAIEKERQRVAAIRAEEIRRAEEARQEDSGGFQWGKLAALGVGAAIGRVGSLPAETQLKIVKSMVQDSMAGQEGVGNFKDTTDSLLAEQNTRQRITAKLARESQAKAVAAEAANNERLLAASRNERKATLERQAKATTVEEARNKKTQEAAQNAKQYNSEQQRLTNQNTQEDSDTDRANIALRKSKWDRPKKIVTLYEPCGAGKTEQEARFNAASCWQFFKNETEAVHDRGLTYGVILSTGETKCMTNSLATTGRELGGDWSCSVAYTKEVLDNGSDRPSRGISK